MSRIWLRVWDTSRRKLKEGLGDQGLVLNVLAEGKRAGQLWWVWCPSRSEGFPSVLWRGRQDQLHLCASQVLLLLKR